MSEKHTGWEPVFRAGVPLKIDGQQVYWHASRGIHAIEREHFYLGGLTEIEKMVLGIVALATTDEPDYRERPICGVSHNVRLGEVW